MFKKNLVLLLAAMMLCLGMSSVAMAAEQQAVIMVNGSGEASVVPDMATVTLGVTANGKTAQLAQAENAKASADVMAALNNLGIFSKDIQTNYNLSPVYEKNNYTKPAGYRADNTLVVRVNDISKVSRVIDAALANGAAKVHGISYGLKDERAAANAALRTAVADARSKADVIASALGVTIVGVQSVTESTNNISTFDLVGAKAMSLRADNGTETQVSAGTVEISSNVCIEYQIK